MSLSGQYGLANRCIQHRVSRYLRDNAEQLYFHLLIFRLKQT
jgi:hypothetical protein